MTQNYFEIDVSTIHQIENGIVLIGKLKFEELLLIHRLTERKENFLDPFDNTIKKISSEENKEFQRWLNPKKLKDIEDFLREESKKNKTSNSLGLFPTSLIVSLDLYEDYDSNQLEKEMNKAYDKSLSGCFISKDYKKLFIPKNNRIALIVDGQHRFVGTQRFIESLKKEDSLKRPFEFPVTFLVGFDIYQVAQIFATVNFEQKRVNTSIYYDIFGSIPLEPSDIKLAHDLALHLNNNENSPLKNMIKLLGKGEGLFSQAFFVRKMFIHLRKGGVWNDIYLDYKEKRGDKYKKLPIFMKLYLNCIKKVYSECWIEQVENKDGALKYEPNNRDYPYNYILCKPTGMGAFFRLINEFYPVIKNLSEQEAENKIIKILQKISPGEAKKLFNTEGPYGKSSSEGFVAKLYKELKGLYGFK